MNTQKMASKGIICFVSAASSWVIGLLGGWSTSLETLLIFMTVDYITGLLCAFVWNVSPKSCDGKFESKSSLKGLFRKGGILLIILVGIFNQIVLLLIFKFLFNIGLINNNTFNIFNYSNLSIIIFNLIPMYPLDGYKILNSILEIYLSFKKSLIISLVVNIITLICFIIFLHFYKTNNYIIIIFLLTMFIKYIKEIRYIFNKFYIERIIYKIDYIGLISVDKLCDIYKNKLNYIKGVNELEYIKSKCGERV